MVINSVSVRVPLRYDIEKLIESILLATHQTQAHRESTIPLQAPSTPQYILLLSTTRQLKMNFAPIDHCIDGFAGPTVGKVDFTPVGDEGMQAEVQDLQNQLALYIHQRGDCGPASADAAALDLVQKIVKFHHESDAWEAHVGKSFIKANLIGTCFFRYRVVTADPDGFQIVCATSSPTRWNSTRGSTTRRKACCTLERNKCPSTSSSSELFSLV